MNQIVTALVEKALSGNLLSLEEGLKILESQGCDYTQFMAGAHYIKEQSLGNRIDLCSIINAKSGRCAENCSFCAQSSHHQTNAPVYGLKSCNEIVAGAVVAEKEGNHCYGIVTSGTSVSPGDEFDTILEAITRIASETTIEPSASLGILTAESASALAKAGCVTYHHNLETARSFFPEICTTHSYEDDVATVQLAKAAGMQVCCGGIFGLGESLEQRVEMGLTLRELNVDSVPLNFLNPIPGTPLANNNLLSPMDCLRIISLYRYLLPMTRITVCGGREKNLRDFQSTIFMAGASGTMVGNYLTTTGRDQADDLQMIKDAEVVINACHN
ncbi:biotin synthase BioB [Geopsychrobacter electrodiphilus]|uniref:biotin synthase BioB n=1 Tax=Geopsychrobacter electrodiphilus TaxID=225196 RepID=UPI0003742FBC|nr:biotin synthase BioB [Geopsychrobacter electrodiphilus]